MNDTYNVSELWLKVGTILANISHETLSNFLVILTAALKCIQQLATGEERGSVCGVLLCTCVASVSVFRCN